MSDRKKSPIRPSRLTDAASIAKIQIDAWRQAYADIISKEFLSQMDYDEKTRRWERNLSGNQASTIVYDGEESILGWASYGESRDQDFQGTEIWAIYVTPQAWGQGIGRRLVDFIHSEPATATSSIVWVLKENKNARRFYNSLGFIPDGKEKLIEIGGDSLPEVRYQRSC